MDALKLMKIDHRKVEDIFKKIDATTERAEKTREELFIQVKMELDAHTHMEEDVFYPATLEADTTHELTLEAYEEHNVVKKLLAELDEDPKGTEEWKAKFTVLQENVLHHVKEEENELFPKVQKLFDAQELEMLGEKMESSKQDYLTHN